MSVLYEIDFFILFEECNYKTHIFILFISETQIFNLCKFLQNYVYLYFQFPLLAGFSISNVKRVIFISNATEHKVNQMQTSHIILQ